MSTPAPFMPGQADAPADPGNLRLNLSGGGLCWRLPFCRTELHRALSAMLRAAGSGPAELDLILVRDAGMAGRGAKAPPSSSEASSFPSTPCTGKRSCTGKSPRNIASGFWPTGSGIWPATTTARKWTDCVPKCSQRHWLG